MNNDEKMDYIIDFITDDIINNPPSIYHGDSSIGVYEYWGAIMVDPPSPYIEIDEKDRDIKIYVEGDIDYIIYNLNNDKNTYTATDDRYTYEFTIDNSFKYDHNLIIVNILWGDVT